MNTFKGRIQLLLISMGALFVCFAPQNARAQCFSQRLTYIVRDMKGAVINPALNDLRYEKDGGFKFGEWKIKEPGLSSESGAKLPPRIVKSLNSNRTLSIEAWPCTFNQPVKLQLRFKGKMMTLRFVMPDPNQAGPRGVPDNYNEYLVDSLPFQSGNFEIVVERPKVWQELWIDPFSPASGWKKVRD